MSTKDKLISDRLRRYCSVNLELLDKKKFKIGQYMGNHRCHFNAVQHATLDKKLEVLLVLTIDGERQPIVHFINKKGEKYIDNTWGYQYEWSDYYFIKTIAREEFDRVGVILGDAKEEIIHQCFNPVERFIFRIGDAEI